MGVDTTVERDPLKPNPKPKPPLLLNPKLKPKLIPTTMVDMVDTMAVDTVMVDTDTDTAMVDTVTITARDLLNPNLTTVDTDTDMAVDTDTVDTVDTVMAVMVTTVELLLRIKSLEKFCLNNLAPTYPF